MDSEATYKVNGRVCTAIIGGCQNDALKEFFKQTQWDIALARPELFLMDRTFIGVAKCDPADEFNEREGKNIAFQRAYDRYLRQKKQKMLEIADYVARRSEIIKNYTETNKKYKNLGKVRKVN